MATEYEIINGVFSNYTGHETETFTVPDGVTEIKGWAFHRNSMHCVVIPEGVKTIGRLAFMDCRNLCEIIFPETLTEIKNQAIAFCNHLDEIVLPSSLISVGDRIFHDCCGIHEITIYGEHFDIDEELFDAYNWDEIAEDYGLCEENTTEVSLKIRRVAVDELSRLLINGDYDDLYMAECCRCECIARVLKHQPENANLLNMAKAHLPAVFSYLVRDSETVQFLLKKDLIADEHLDVCMEIAEKRNAADTEKLLTDYRTAL